MCCTKKAQVMGREVGRDSRCKINYSSRLYLLFNTIAFGVAPCNVSAAGHAYNNNTVAFGVVPYKMNFMKPDVDSVQNTAVALSVVPMSIINALVLSRCSKACHWQALNVRRSVNVQRLPEEHAAIFDSYSIVVVKVGDKNGDHLFFS
jgi:hypothetical protein